MLCLLLTIRSKIWELSAHFIIEYGLCWKRQLLAKASSYSLSNGCCLCLLQPMNESVYITIILLIHWKYLTDKIIIISTKNNLKFTWREISYHCRATCLNWPTFSVMKVISYDLACVPVYLHVVVVIAIVSIKYPHHLFTDRPDKPTNLKVTNVQSRSVVIEFKPGHDGQAPVTEWIVQTGNTDKTVWNNLTSITDPGSTFRYSK